MRNAIKGSLVALSFVLVTGCEMMPPPVQSNARIRVVHASPDAPAVDVCGNGAVAFAGATFPGATDYAEVPAGTLAVNVVAAGSDCATDGVIVADLPLAADTDTTVVAANLLADIEPIVLNDDNSDPAAGSAKVRFVHASPDAPTVDITLVDGTTLFDNVAFKGVGDYIEVDAQTVDLEVRDETGENVVLTLPGVTLEDGTVYTIYAIGLLAGDPDLDALITVDNG